MNTNANASHEPSFKYHHTVMFSLAYPDYVCHEKTKRCKIEYPHNINQCGEFYKIKNIKP